MSTQTDVPASAQVAGQASTATLRRELARALPDRPFRIELWDGSSLEPTRDGDDGPCFTARSPEALAHLLRAPGQLGLGRAYVSGSLDVDDFEAVMRVVDTWQAPRIGPLAKLRLAAAAARIAGLRAPTPPAAELRLRGRRHSRERDAEAVRHHYDVPGEFFALFLGPSMTYSCAFFSRGATTLEEAQRAKLELTCAKLELRPGDRVLDVGCGWGSFAIHAAREHGAHVTGITLSERQAEMARRRVQDAGVADSVDIRVADYRELGDEQFDAVASIGMVEHVGGEQIDVYARRLAGLLRPGGRLLNHGIARLRHENVEPGAFNDRYVFPDGEPLQLSRVLDALEHAGFETLHVEGFRSDYAETLRHWAERLDDHLDRAIQLAGPERVRVWRLYLRAARNGFLNGFTSIYQVRCRLPEG